ncbi:hypothetical protein [Neobacillus cucumis]|nr:hypothetical protein [Neobacillus cucumis]MDR4945059.1 hypothetical protein [Neobacillus cucumis]
MSERTLVKELGKRNADNKQEENEMKFIGDKESLNGDLQDLFLAYEEENR